MAFFILPSTDIVPQDRYQGLVLITRKKKNKGYGYCVNVTSNNISVTVSFMGGWNRVPTENQWAAASHWQTLKHIMLYLAWTGFKLTTLSFVTTLVLHFDKQNKEIIIYNSNKHFHSSFTHTLLPFCFSKIFDCSWHFVLNQKSWKKNLITIWIKQTKNIMISWKYIVRGSTFFQMLKWYCFSLIYIVQVNDTT
jgi:L-lactate permease